MPLHYLITAGPTHESIDEVRYIANRSSGAMGLALAAAACEAGHHVTLLLGPVAAEPPSGVRTHRFESAADLAALLHEHFAACDVLVMAAAVADYRPVVAQTGKIERRAGRLTLELQATPDLVAACAARRRPGQYLVGFALADASRLAEVAVSKLRRKLLDAIVANPLAAMGAEQVSATVYTADGHAHQPVGSAPASGAAPAGHPPLMPKNEFARWLVRFIDEHKA